MSLAKRSLAEFIGTFWLVFGGCGSAILAYGVPEHGISIVGVALAFGLSVVTMAYAIGHISGCHINPAITIGLFVSGRFKCGIDTTVYILSQVLGGILAALALYYIAQPDLSQVGVGTFATNGWSETLNVNGLNAFGGKSFGMLSALVTEMILTCFLVLVVIGATDRRAHQALAPLAIGLSITLIHLVSIPVTNTSVNPARSTAVALITGGQPLNQLWLFWLAPIVGAIIAGVLYKCVFEEKTSCCNNEKATHLKLVPQKGDCKSGDCKSGDCKSGDCKSGDCKSGDCKSGDCKSGDCKSGDCKSGDCKSGDCKSGDCNEDCNEDRSKNDEIMSDDNNEDRSKNVEIMSDDSNEDRSKNVDAKDDNNEDRSKNDEIKSDNNNEDRSKNVDAKSDDSNEDRSKNVETKSDDSKSNKKDTYGKKSNKRRN